MRSLFKLIWILLASMGLFSAKHVDQADRVMDAFTMYVKKKYGLVLSGSGGAMMDGIQVVFLSYNSHQQVDVNTARSLYVELVEELLNRINSDEKIRPYLRDYPFNENNIELDIGFYDSQNKRYSDGSVAYICLINGTVYYNILDPKITVSNPLKTIHKESYKEALGIVKNRKGSVPN